MTNLSDRSMQFAKFLGPISHELTGIGGVSRDNSIGKVRELCVDSVLVLTLTGLGYFVLLLTCILPYMDINMQ